MCYMALIPIAMTAVSAVMGAVGNAQQAAAQNRSLEANAETSRQNAQNSRYEASYARQQAERNAAEENKKTAVLIGSQRAKMGASGAVVDMGSFLDVTMSTAEEGAMNAMACLQEGDTEAWRHEVRAGQYDSQSNSFLSSRTNPNAVLAGGLLSGAAQTAASAYGMSGFMGGSTSASKNPGYTDPQLKAMGAQ